MNVLSLFDGMSCGQIALNRVGIKYDNYFASEIDKHAIQVTQKNYPNTIQLGSVTEVDGKSLPKIDLLIGGSPCTNFSFAGKRMGMVTKDNVEILTLEHYLELKNEGFKFEGQSYLFWEYVRILKETNPKYFLLENVKMSSKWKDLITKILGVEPIYINSEVISAASRPRLYWTNIPNVKQPKEKNILFKDIIDTDNSNYYYWKDFQMEKYFNKQYVRRDYYRIEEPNSKVQCLLAQFGQNHPKCWSDKENLFRKLTPLEFERCQTVPDNYTKVDGISDNQRYKMLGNGWTVDVIAHIFKNIKEVDNLKSIKYNNQSK